MKSLLELNGYSDIEVEYSDARTAGVLFDRPNAINVSLLINENQTHTLPTGIEINDIVDYLVAQVYVELDFSTLLDSTNDPVQISTAGFPAHMSLSSVDNVYTIGPLQSVSDWLTVKSAAIQLPFGYSGEFDYTATISYFIDDSTQESVTWTVATTVIPIEYLSDTTPFVYVPNTTVNANLVSVIADTAVFNPIWTLTITPSNTAPVNTIASTGTGGTFSFNATTKVATIVGNKTQVNNRLVGLQITFNKANPNFNFTFKLENNINSDFDLQIQTMTSKDLVSDMSVTATLFADTFTANLVSVASVSATVLRVKRFASTVSASATLTAQPAPVTRFGSAAMSASATMTCTAFGGEALEFIAVDGENSSNGVAAEGELDLTVVWQDIGTTTVAIVTTTNQTRTYTYNNVREIRSARAVNQFNADYPTEIYKSVRITHNYTNANESGKTAIVTGTLSAKPSAGITLPLLAPYRDIFRVVKWGKDIPTGNMKFRVSNTSFNILTEVPSTLPSNITDIDGLFQNTHQFNQDLSGWNVSHLTSLRSLFNNATAFNQDISSWNVSNVTDMSEMFRGNIDIPSDFNQPLNSWNVSNVTNMDSMFEFAGDFNQPLNSWNVSSVTNMNEMFRATTSFNQPLNSWNVSNVTNMTQMFASSQAFSQPLNSWNVSNVTNMSQMFAVSNFNNNINGWVFKEDANISALFFNNTVFNQPLNNWVFTNGDAQITDMFGGATAFNQNINTWNISNVSSIADMFNGATSFNQPLNDWDTSNLNSRSDMSRLFKNATAFNQNLSGWCVTDITSEPVEFSTGSALTNANKPVWGTCP